MLDIGTSKEQLKVQIPLTLSIESEPSNSFKVISNRDANISKIEEEPNHEKETCFKKEETLQ